MHTMKSQAHPQYRRLIEEAEIAFKVRGPKEVVAKLQEHGIKVTTQQLGNWSIRGVPAAKALEICSVLGVRPEYIHSGASEKYVDRETPPPYSLTKTVNSQLDDLNMAFIQLPHQAREWVIAKVKLMLAEEAMRETGEPVKQPDTMTGKRARSLMSDPRVLKLLDEIEQNKK